MSLYSADEHLLDFKERPNQTYFAQAMNGNARKGISMPLKVGELAPEISVPSSWGDTFTLSEAIKDHAVVLTFYFFAFTGG